MARRNARREAALQQAKERERAAGKKISKLNAQGFDFSGKRQKDGTVKRNPLDPRVGAKSLESMTTRELSAHTRRVDAFVSRNTRFVKSFAGAPVPKGMWEQYQALEAINNAKADVIYSRYGSVKLPESDTTIGGREENIRPKRVERERARNQGRVFEHIERPLNTIMGAEGVQELIKLYSRKAEGKYREETIGKRLNSGDAILKGSGFGDLIEAVEGLTLEQKQLLIDHSTFFDIALEHFSSPPKSEVQELMDADYEEREGIAKDIHVRDELQAQLEWVQSISPAGTPRDENGKFITREAWAERVRVAQDKAPEFPTINGEPISREAWVTDELAGRHRQAPPKRGRRRR